MAEKKEKISHWRKRDWILFFWFLSAILQIHYSVLLFFGLATGATFFLWNGIMMMVEGGVGCYVAYTDD
jgi:Zn-dependent protease with chaperone function